MTKDGTLPNEEYEGLKQRLLSFGGDAAIIQVPTDLHIHRLWLLEFVGGRYFLRLFMDEVDIDVDEAERLGTRVKSTEFLDFTPPVVIEHEGVLAKIASLGSGKTILEIPDESDEFCFLMQLAAARYNSDFHLDN